MARQEGESVTCEPSNAEPATSEPISSSTTPTTRPTSPPARPSVRMSSVRSSSRTSQAEKQRTVHQQTAATWVEKLLNPLPADWHRQIDSSGQTYYWNAVSNGIMYEFPSPLPHGWRLARDSASGCVYTWNFYTRAVAPYDPIRRQLGLAWPRPIGPPPPQNEPTEAEIVPGFRGGSCVDVGAATAPAPPQEAPPVTLQEVSECDCTLLCGWSELTDAAWDASDAITDGDDANGGEKGSSTFLALSREGKHARLDWFECCRPAPEGESELEGTYLKLEGQADLREVQALKREKPDSPRDFTFKIELRERSLTVNPGNHTTFKRWEEALLMAMSMPVVSLPRALRRAASSRTSARKSQGS